MLINVRKQLGWAASIWLGTLLSVQVFNWLVFLVAELLYNSKSPSVLYFLTFLATLCLFCSNCSLYIIIIKPPRRYTLFWQDKRMDRIGYWNCFPLLAVSFIQHFIKKLTRQTLGVFPRFPLWAKIPPYLLLIFFKNNKWGVFLFLFLCLS